MEGGNDARYVPTGHLVYALGNTLFGIAFDADSRTVSGGAVPLVQGVRRSSAALTGAAPYSVSATGDLIYVPGESVGTHTLAWVDREGNEEPVAVQPGDYFFPRLSPDGTRLVYSDTVGNLAWKAANNTGSVELLSVAPGREGYCRLQPFFFTQDGAMLVFDGGTCASETRYNIGMITLEPGAAPVGLLEDAFNETNAEVSPNGRWMAYQSNESGQFEIYMRPFPNVDDDRVQVSSAGGTRPLWSRDGSELFYLEEPVGGGQPRLMSAAVQTGHVFSVQARVPVMDWPYYAGTPLFGWRPYDVSLDSQRFLAITQTAGAGVSSDQIIVVEHWTEELKQLVPTD